MEHVGEFAALGVAIVWTITALAFEQASKQVGSLNVNMIRLPLAFLFLCVFTFFNRGVALPFDANSYQWFWLMLSGLVGFVLGDLFLFKSFMLIGSRFSMLIMTLVPPITAFTGWLVLSERLTMFSFMGILLTILGILIVVHSKRKNDNNTFSKVSVRGILYAIGGAIGQSLGLILSKIGMGSYNAFASTQIRIIAGILGFAIIIIFMNRIKSVFQALSNKKGMTGIIVGSFFGPFIGVSLSLYSVQHANTGVASTIMAIVPILIIVPSIVIFKQKATFAEILGAFISVAGIALFFI
jgi:drug/metabolite transporter (DMT)-like permease